MSPTEHGSVTEARRASARRTAWIMVAIACAVYVGFLLLGVFGK
jgi:hypothetical protein